jgi:hypothetical protein
MLKGRVTRSLTVLAVSAAALIVATAATARATGTAEVSANWSGYVVSAPSTSYTSVTATWRQPTVSCGVTDAGSSAAFWVGLGGYSQTSQALEQVGRPPTATLTPGGRRTTPGTSSCRARR